MRLFETSQGFIFSFGFDMKARKPRRRHVAWCDPGTKDWDVNVASSAGTIEFPFDIDPEFIRESNGAVVAYQPGVCLEFHFEGAPFIWTCTIMRPPHERQISGHEEDEMQDEESLARIG
jgi:hypothetical protein